MNLTKEEKRFLGKQARIVGHSDGSVIIWRWLNAITPFRPRSLAELYTTALRSVRHRTARLLEAEDHPGECAGWIVSECLGGGKDGSGERLLARLGKELGISRAAACSCMDGIRAFWSRLPCGRQPAWEELGHYAWAENMMQTLIRANEAGVIPTELMEPITSERLAAVSHLAFSQSYVAAAGDPTAEAKLIDQFLIRRQRLVQALADHRSRGRSGPVFWNLPGFYEGTKTASDLAELQSYTDLLILLKAFAVVEYHITLSGGELDRAMTLALCNILRMVIGHLDARDLQTMRASVALSCPVKSVDPTALEKRDDYVQALFRLDLRHVIRSDDWLHHSLLYWRTSLALPRLHLSKMECLLLVLTLAIVVRGLMVRPALWGPLFMLIALLGVVYLAMRGGLEFVCDFFGRMFRAFFDRHPILATICVLVLCYLTWKYFGPPSGFFS